MWSLIIETLVFLIPIYSANGFAGLSPSLPIIGKWNFPIDFGKKLNDKRILGKGKTFRGLISGSLVAMLGGYIQYLISESLNFQYLTGFNDKQIVFFLLLSLLTGFGGLFGDIAKSFLKRRIGIKSGRPWIGFDQLDFIVGGFLFGAIIYFPNFAVLIVAAVITPIIHLATNISAYFLKLKDVWW